MSMETILTVLDLPDGSQEDSLIFKEKEHLQTMESSLSNQRFGPLTSGEWSMKEKGDLPFKKGFILHAPCSRETLFKILKEAGETQGLEVVLTADGTTKIDQRPHHEIKKLKFGGMEADVDLLIAPLILRLWKHGIKTCQSCEESEPGTVWIQFPEYEDAKRFFDAASLHASLDWSKDYVQMEGSDFDGEGCFSIRFGQRDLRIIVKQFPAKAPI